MVAITKPTLRRNNFQEWPLVGLGFGLLEALSVYLFGHVAGLWWISVLVIFAIELRGLRTAGNRQERQALLWERTAGIIMGVGATLIVATNIKLVTQVVVAVLYAVWLAWRELRPKDSDSLAQLLIVQAVAFEAIFLMSATWQTTDGHSLPAWLTLVLVWASAYFGVYATFMRRGDRSAGVLAASWGVIATEVSWVLMLWLITYTTSSGYVMVPQPVLVLTALAYVFGSILHSSRQGSLSRTRLWEYMIIALILVVIVVAGTSWHGNG